MPPEAPIPLSVIGGYLGSGKTTLINRIIAGRGAPGLCVIVNDFGELDLDAEILRRSDGLTLTLANGCVCCSAASGLYDAFEAALGASPRPEHIVIEASGVADPARLNAIARAEPSLAARAVITLADCLAISRDIEDPLKRPDILRQLRAADLILLSKTELAEADTQARVRAMIAGIAPAASIEPLAGPSLPDSLTLALNTAPNPPRLMEAPPHDASERYDSCSFHCGEIGDLESFLDGIGALAGTLARLKGIIQVKGRPAPLILDLAGRRVTMTPLPSPARETGLITAIFAKGANAGAKVREILRRHAPDVRAIGGDCRTGEPDYVRYNISHIGRPEILK